MNSIVSALVGSGAAGLTGWVIMSARLRRKEKGDRIGDLRLDVDRRFEDHRVDSDKRFAAIVDEIKGLEERLTDKFAGAISSLEVKVEGSMKALEFRLADKFSGEIKDSEQRLVGELKAQGERVDRVRDVLRNHGERLARIEAKLEVDPPAEAA